MGFSLTSPAPKKCDPTAENRVWGFFGEAPKTSRANHPQSLQPRQGNRPSPTTIASGRTYWPSRDPIEERGGINLYGMVKNNAVTWIDFLGLQQGLGTHTGFGKPGSNCASDATCDPEDTGFDPSIPEDDKKPIKGFEDCRRVKGEGDCKDPPEEKHVVIYIQDQGDRTYDDDRKPNSYHVIHEDPTKPGTYSHQAGQAQPGRPGTGPQFNNVEDPDAAAAAYYAAVNKKGAKLKEEHLCCPCKKEKK